MNTTGDERIVGDVHDRVISHLFESALTLASIVNRQGVDDDVAEQLRAVIEQLDAAAREIRAAALALHIRDRDARSDTPNAPTTAVSDVPIDERRVLQTHRRHLCRFNDGQVFAYAIGGHDFFRVSDHELWAHESGDLLLSARSGRALARRVGKAFHDIESNAPLYYERSQ